MPRAGCPTSCLGRLHCLTGFYLGHANTHARAHAQTIKETSAAYPLTLKAKRQHVWYQNLWCVDKHRPTEPRSPVADSEILVDGVTMAIRFKNEQKYKQKSCYFAHVFILFFS